ncbi:hypothetical protein MLD38_012854 [Melastoma candidum]|uniref:Uncharacterized protein n=1 Tax=Melastoma candidum TaxID=119954 RepID=A0ACB9R8T0_9MYRT|nr:hypothetical protein MLD38_012854 [Melastoma candidum]
MAVSDAVVANLTTIYVAAIALIKVYGLILGKSYGGGFLLLASSAVVGDPPRRHPGLGTCPRRRRGPCRGNMATRLARGGSAGTASQSSPPLPRSGSGCRSSSTCTLPCENPIHVPYPWSFLHVHTKCIYGYVN